MRLPVDRSTRLSAPHRVAQRIFSPSAERDDVTADVPMLALIFTRNLRPMTIGSDSGWLMFAGSTARPAAISSRTTSGATPSRSAANSLSGVTSPRRSYARLVAAPPAGGPSGSWAPLCGQLPGCRGRPASSAGRHHRPGRVGGTRAYARVANRAAGGRGAGHARIRREGAVGTGAGRDPAAESDRVVTVPNALSVARLVGVPLFLWLVLVPRADYWAVGVLVLAGLSDWLDGKIARAWHQQSRFGEMLDPAAGRLDIAATLVPLAIRAIIPWWLLRLLVCRGLVLGGAL